MVNLMFEIHEMEYFLFVTMKLHKHVEKSIPEKSIEHKMA